MLERHETFLGEQMRREQERRYAETHRLAKQAGLLVPFYQKMVCHPLIRTILQLFAFGRRQPGPLECGANPAMAHVK